MQEKFNPMMEFYVVFIVSRTLNSTMSKKHQNTSSSIAAKTSVDVGRSVRADNQTLSAAAATAAVEVLIKV